MTGVDAFLMALPVKENFRTRARQHFCILHTVGLFRDSPAVDDYETNWRLHTTSHLVVLPRPWQTITGLSNGALPPVNEHGPGEIGKGGIQLGCIRKFAGNSAHPKQVRLLCCVVADATIDTSLPQFWLRVG